MRHTRPVVDGVARPERPLRSAAPEWAGPLGSSGAAPDDATFPATVDRPAPESREPESEWARPEPVADTPARPGEEKGEAPTSAPPPAPEAPTTTLAPDQPTVTVAATTAFVPETSAGPRRRVRFAHALRRASRTRAVARDVRAWSARPSGRVALPAVLLLALVVAGAAAGAVLIPKTAGERRVAAGATASEEATLAPTLPDGLAPLPSTTAPVVGGATPSPGATPTTALPAGGRPADVLAAWANQTGTKLDVPVVAMQAYGYAELVLETTRPDCNLRWTTLAAIGKIESNHGRHNATLGTDGESAPRILGPVLDGTGGNQRILDTDDGVLDGDITYDRAVGAMQFIPATWKQHEVDADNDGLKDVNDIDDAALAAGNYLCQGGRKLDLATDWWNAILSYNDVQRYAQAVFDAANDYGSRSRT
jgi:membrane-bound lytic murein transglycosylase B